MEHAVSATTPTFITPLEIKCKSPLNGDTIIRVNISSNNDTYVIPMNKTVTGLEIDPNNWVLNTDSVIKEDPSLISLSTASIELDKDIKVFPNPTTDFVSISNNTEQSAQFTLRNLLGTPLIQITNSKANQSIDLSAYANGIYLLEINNGAGRVVKKLIKQ